MDDTRPAPTPPRSEPMVSRIETGPLAVLRLFRPTDAEVAAASERLGFPLALEPLRLTNDATRSVRLGPGEWVVFADPTALSERLGDLLHQVHDVGHARARWRVNDWELLQRGCGLDLDPSVFATGSCVRTYLAQVAVLILRPSTGAEIDVIGDNSLADYLETWLMDAAQGLSGA